MKARAGIPFVVSAPSGAGKTTVCRELIKRDARLSFSISHTTRAPRAGEVCGRDYHFVTPAQFEQKAQAGAFAEHAEYAGNRYGTGREELNAPLNRGQDLLLEVEVQGARQLRESIPEARFIFLLPPSPAELERRLRARNTNSEGELQNRLAAVAREINEGRNFNYVIVNREIETTVAELAEIIAAERRGNSARIKQLRETFAPARALPA